MNNPKNEVKKTIPFAIASKRIKYFRSKFNKNMRHTLDTIKHC